VDASQEDIATGGPDPSRGIYPTVVVVTSEGAAVVGQDEIRAAYEQVLAHGGGTAGSGSGGA
jgi:proteasome beta subunit